MYQDLPLDTLVPNSQSTNRISRMFAKKLKHNIEQLSLYETLTVRPHPLEEGKYEVLNGHARLEALRSLKIPEVKCDIWKVDDIQAEMFLAILNKLRGSEAPELRMNLLMKLLQKHSPDELAAHIPETVSHLEDLQKLPEAGAGKELEELQEKPDVVIIDFYLTTEQHRLLSTALNHIIDAYSLSDSSQALVHMAKLYLDSATKRIKAVK